MLPIGSHILSLISSCDDGVYVCTRLRNRAKAGRDMRNKGNFLQKIFLRNMKINFNRCEVLENNTRLSVTVRHLSVCASVVMEPHNSLNANRNLLEQ